MNLPSNEHTFHFKDHGERTKQVFEGHFTVKCILTMQESVDVGLRLDALNGGSKTLVPGVQILNRAFAELDVRIIKAPSWWKDSANGRELFDSNIVLGVFDKAIDGERIYEDRIKEASGDAQERVENQKSEKKA